MAFEFSERSKDLKLRISKFLDDHVYPAEEMNAQQKKKKKYDCWIMKFNAWLYCYIIQFNSKIIESKISFRVSCPDYTDYKITKKID
jgi:hypothetical protein